MTDGGVFICPPLARRTCPTDAVLAVGFGMVTVTRNGRLVWCGDDEETTLQRFEDRAAVESGKGRGRWVVAFDAPLSSATYTRQRNGEWLLTEKGMGFA